jgi:hypothetical protein
LIKLQHKENNLKGTNDNKVPTKQTKNAHVNLTIYFGVKLHEALSFTCDAEECITFSALELRSCVEILVLVSHPFGFIIDCTQWEVTVVTSSCILVGICTGASFLWVSVSCLQLQNQRMCKQPVS